MSDSPLIKITSSYDILLGQAISFNKIIEILGINRFNFRTFLIIGLFLMTEGAQMIVLSLLMSKLDEIWVLTTFKKGSMGSAIFIGLTIGSLLSGYLSDRYGRKPTFLTGAVLLLIFSISSSMAEGFLSFIFLRLLCGFGFGITVPALFALATELTPSAYRSTVLINIWLLSPMGSVFSILMAKYFLDSNDGWRYVLLFASLPCINLIIFSSKILESPVFHMSKGKYDKSFETLDIMIKLAKMDDKICIGELEKNDLISEAENNQLNKEVGNYKMLFSLKYRRLTCLICTICFIVSFNMHGSTYILPQIFKEEFDNDKTEGGDVYLSLLFGCFLEIPNCLLAGYLSNHRYFYRVKTMLLGFFINIFSCVFIILAPIGISMSAAIFKCSMIISMNVAVVYSCEAYPTKIRAMGLGLGFTLARFAAILTPYISQILFDSYRKLLFVVYGVGSFVGLISCIALPFETFKLSLK